MKKVAIVLLMFLGTINMTSQEVFDIKGLKGLKITLSENTLEYNYKGASTLFDVEFAGKEGSAETYNVVNSTSSTKHRFKFIRGGKKPMILWETRDDFNGATSQMIYQIKKVTQL